LAGELAFDEFLAWLEMGRVRQSSTSCHLKFDINSIM
jgi:hypothetical protein